MSGSCQTCKYAEWISAVHGHCRYPLPACVQLQEIRAGVWGKLGPHAYGVDYGRVGILHADGSVIEVLDCPCWSSKPEQHDG